VGTNPDYAPANTHFVQDGRFLTDADINHSTYVCVIGPDVAEATFPHQDPIDRELTIGGVAYRVVGLFESKGGFIGGNNDNYIAIPITTFDEQMPEVKNGGGDTIHIATVPRRAEDYNALIEEETAILRLRRGLRSSDENDFAIFTTVGQLRNFQQITGGVAAAMLVIAGIALLSGWSRGDEHHVGQRDPEDSGDRGAEGSRSDP
jgi:putative ABC transport system permease protein